jgi:hypothetical protein
MALLEVFYRKNWISGGTFDELKTEAIEIAAMIKGRINSLEK